MPRPHDGPHAMFPDNPSSRRKRNAAVCPPAADAPTDNTPPQTVAVTISPISAIGRVSDIVAPLSETEASGDGDQPALKLGDQIGGFRLVESLGRGAFAQVFLAEQTAIANRRVVLKVAARANPEADRLGRLQHPNVVPIHSVHAAAPYFLICMPYLGRQTLADRIKSPACPPRDVRWALETLSGLAAGLDHAHRRGILHLDIKPANVLLADGGEPMLLDFNLAHDTSTDRGLAGGTLAYMAPEQLANLIPSTTGRMDERTDLYSLGVLAYELLIGVRPFQTTPTIEDPLHRHLAARQVVPTLRDRNRAVSPAVEAVVRKLLAPDPKDRYQTALELKTDLDRHLADLPLVSAPDRSVRERFGKWRRRNPWVPLRAAVAAAVGLALGFVILDSRRNAEAREVAAVAQARQTQGKLSALRIDLTSPNDAAARARGRAAAADSLRVFGLPDDPRWRGRPPFARLPDALKPAVAADLGEILVLLAHAAWQDSRLSVESGRRDTAQSALRLNQLAEGCFAPAAAPPMLYAQRAELSAALGETPAPAPTAAPGDPRAHYLDAVGLLAAGKFLQASRSLERVVAGEPGHAAAHFSLAFCRQQLGQYARALERYDTAHALLPGDPRPAFNRGLLYGLQRKHKFAEEEFTLAIRVAPDHGESYQNRATARLAQGKLREAEEDLTAALERNVPALQVYPRRAQVRARLGDHRGAEADGRAAKEYEPHREGDFLARGRSRLPADPAAALADFEAAAQLSPASLAALQNQAHVHSDHLRDAKRALALITRAVELYPEFAPARAGRAVLLARMGKRDDAHREAEAALALSDDATVCYQAACVFALTSATTPADADRAFALLRQAIRDGFRDARTLDADPDVAPLRARPEFAAVSAALKDITR